jgi:hypothetical protein
MANSLTNYGQEVALLSDTNRTLGSATNAGGLGNLGSNLKLYADGSTPNVNGAGFTEVTNGNGYATGGIALSSASYTLSTVSGSVQAVIADQTWTASGGSVSNIAGVYLTDASGNVLAWWERSAALTLTSGDTLVADDLTVRLV